MGLKFLEARDLKDYMNLLQTEQALANEFAFANHGANNFRTMPIHTYLHQLDKIIATGRLSDGVPGPVGDALARIAFDPLLASASFPDAFVEIGRSGFGNNVQQPHIPGDPNSPGGQRLWTTEVGSATPIVEVSPLINLLTTGSPAFPTIVPANGPIRDFGGIGAFGPTNNPGGWQGGRSLVTGEEMAPRMIFEGLTDGIPGETNLVGAGVYPKGLMLAKINFGTCPAPIGTGGANDCDHAIVWIDLNTGGVDGRMINTPGVAHSTFINSEAPIAGQEFAWYPAQYVPDTDATFARPKGELHLYSMRENVPADPANFPQSIFVKIIEYNPFGVVATGGARTRTHERVILLSSVDFNDSPIFDVAGANSILTPRQMRLMYHPPSRRFMLVLADGQFGITTPGPAPGGESFIGYWARQVEASVLTTPVPRDVPRTNDVVDYQSFTTGTLGEPGSGVSVDWELFRNSTENEVLDASTFPGTSTVANAPIDQAFPAVNEGTLVVVADTVTLVQGVDYNVTLVSGVISWITDQSGAALVTASYEHRENNASPAHGLLLVTASQSDLNGRVVTQVRYEDDDALAGKFDRLRGTLV